MSLIPLNYHAYIMTMAHLRYLNLVYDLTIPDEVFSTYAVGLNAPGDALRGTINQIQLDLKDWHVLVPTGVETTFQQLWDVLLTADDMFYGAIILPGFERNTPIPEYPGLEELMGGIYLSPNDKPIIGSYRAAISKDTISLLVVIENVVYVYSFAKGNSPYNQIFEVLTNYIDPDGKLPPAPMRTVKGNAEGYSNLSKRISETLPIDTIMALARGTDDKEALQSIRRLNKDFLMKEVLSPADTEHVLSVIKGESIASITVGYHPAGGKFFRSVKESLTITFTDPAGVAMTIPSVANLGTGVMCSATPANIKDGFTAVKKLYEVVHYDELQKLGRR